MSLISTIKADQLQARKDRDSFLVQTLTTLIGEVERIGKNDGNRETYDIETISVLKKSIKNANETIKAIQENPATRGNYTATQAEEIRILNTYMPTMYSENKIMEFLLAYQQDLEEDDKELTLPLGMKFLKDNHAGNYDGKLASFVLRDLLAM